MTEATADNDGHRPHCWDTLHPVTLIMRSPAMERTFKESVHLQLCYWDLIMSSLGTATAGAYVIKLQGPDVSFGEHVIYALLLFVRMMPGLSCVICGMQRHARVRGYVLNACYALHHVTCYIGLQLLPDLTCRTMRVTINTCTMFATLTFPFFFFVFYHQHLGWHMINALLAVLLLTHPTSGTCALVAARSPQLGPVPLPPQGDTAACQRAAEFWTSFVGHINGMLYGLMGMPPTVKGADLQQPFAHVMRDACSAGTVLLIVATSAISLVLHYHMELRQRCAFLAASGVEALPNHEEQERRTLDAIPTVAINGGLLLWLLLMTAFPCVPFDSDP